MLIEGVEGYGTNGAVVGVEVDGEEGDKSDPCCGLGCYVGDYYAANEHAKKGDYCFLG